MPDSGVFVTTVAVAVVDDDGGATLLLLALLVIIGRGAVDVTADGTAADANEEDCCF